MLYEVITESITAQYDFVVSRAVTAFPEFVAMTRKNISTHQRNGLPNGIIYSYNFV